MKRLRVLPIVFACVCIAYCSVGLPQDSHYPFDGLAKLVCGEDHTHGIASNDYTFQSPAKSYLQFMLQKLKIDPDHLLAEDIEPTVERAWGFGDNFIGWQDHGGEFTPGYWRRLADAQQQYTKIISLHGFEWTQGSLLQLNPPGKARHGMVNHIGVFGTEHFTDVSLRKESLDAGMKETHNVNELYQWLLNERTQNVFCCFNHPGYGDDQFNHFTVPDELEPVKQYFRIIEVGSGSGVFYEDIASLEKYYIQAIQKGWRVMPGVGADNYGKLTYQDARAHHLAIWQFNQSLQEAIKECQGYASEDANVVVKFWAENVHCPPGEGGYYERAAMGHIATFCKFGPPKLCWEVTNASSPITQLTLTFVYPNLSETIEAQGSQGSYVMHQNPRLIGCYLKGKTKANTLFVTAPVYFVHRNYVEQKVQETYASSGGGQFGTMTMRLSGLKIAGSNSFPTLQHWVAPILELNWSKYNLDWEIVCKWKMLPETFFIEEQVVNDPDVLMKGKTMLCSPTTRIPEQPLEPGRYRITICMRKHGDFDTERILGIFAFVVQDSPMPYVPRALLPH